jgi:hypothetical protein
VDENSDVRNYATNGFVISETGVLDIVMDYLPQRWFLFGGITTAIVLAISFGYLILNRLNFWMIFRTPFYQRHFPDLVQGDSPPIKKIQSSGTKWDIEENESAQPKTEKRILDTIVNNASSIPIFIALVLVIQCVITLLLVSEKTIVDSTLNAAIILVYFLLVVGVIWKFIQFMRK